MSFIAIDRPIDQVQDPGQIQSRITFCIVVTPILDYSIERDFHFEKEKD